MFMKKTILLLFVLFSVFLSACEDKSSKEQIEQARPLLNKSGFLTNPVSAVVNNELVLLLGEKRGVVFYQVGKETILSEDNSGNQWLYYDGKTLYALWWTADAEKAKRLKIRTSTDGGKTFNPVVTINTETGVLADVAVAYNGKGAIAVAYTDERRAGYGVYVNYSTDDGKTWLAQDERFDRPVITEAMKAQNKTQIETFANSPQLHYLGDKLVAIWQQVDMTEMGQSMLRIVSKTSEDNGKTWSTEANIFTAPNMQPVEMNSFTNGKAVYLFAMLKDETKGFTGFYSTDPNATNWAEISNANLGEDIKARSVSWIKGVFSGDNLLLAFTTAAKNGGKSRAETAILSTKNHQWTGVPKLLDADKGHELTKSTYPSIANLQDGSVMIVWEDYRSLAPSLYMNLTKDHGVTWLPAALPITTPGLSVAKDPKILVGQDKIWITYFTVKLDSKNPSGTRVFQELVQTDGKIQFPNIQMPTLASAKLRDRLIERANQFWALREERKWEETWDYMEPIYRERFDKDQWLAQQGKISFSKTVVDESTVKIIGNLAWLSANIELSVNQQISKEGLLESAPPNQQKVEMKWGWFYDDWYFMPDIIFGNHLEY